MPTPPRLQTNQNSIAQSSIGTSPASAYRVLRRRRRNERRGALCYFAAWDARRAKLFDRCEEKDQIVPFDKLVEQFMSVEPYSEAQRVFVIVDNGSAHRGKASIKRLQRQIQKADPLGSQPGSSAIRSSGSVPCSLLCGAPVCRVFAIRTPRLRPLTFALDPTAAP